MRESGLTIELNVSPPVRVTLEDIRIDVSGLMRWVYVEIQGTHPDIRISLTYPSGNGFALEVTSTAMEALLRGVFFLLSDLIASWPDDVGKKVSNILPEIWINGKGAIIEATYPATHAHKSWSVAYKHSHLRKQELVQIGYRKAAAFPDELDPSARRIEDGVTRTMQMIRRTLWKDWRSKRPSKRA